MNYALLISISAGILIFLFIIGIAALVYRSQNKNMRYHRENPNDWLLYRFNDRLYDFFFGRRFPEDIAQKLGVEVDEYYKNCLLIREDPDLKSIVMGYLYGYLVFLAGIVLAFLVHILFLPISLMVMYELAFYKKTMVKSKATKMREQVAAEFPRFIAVLSTELDVSIPIEVALQLLCQKFDGLIAREFLESMGEVKLGAVGWQTALKNVAEKYDIDMLSDFVMDVTTSYQKGVSIADTVRERVKELKQRRIYEVRDRAGKTENTILIPIALLQFVPMLLFVLLPSFLSIAGL